MNDKGTNPAALSAAMNGDFANAIVASTPGGIEAQERAGQASLQAGTLLPRIVRHSWNNEPTHAQIAAATGIQWMGEHDDIFMLVKLPTDWSIRAQPGSAYWSHLCDKDGNKRASIFYKAAFHDRSAHMHFEQRYQVNCLYPESDAADQAVRVRAIDMKGEVVLREFGASADYTEREKLEREAGEWLDQQYPDRANPLAYW